MKRIYLSVALILLGFVAHSQDIPAYKAEDLMARIENGKDTFYVVNFWATWCAPCVKELPEFAHVEQKYQGRPVKVLLVSMDFKEDFPKKVEKFINKKDLKQEVVWLNETNANEFIPKIEPEWQGSLPTTILIYKKNYYKKLFEGVIKSPMLTLLIDEQLAR